MKSSLALLLLSLAGLHAKLQYGPIAEYNHNNPRAGCDPDYGWMDGVEGSGKCYMLIKNLDFDTCYNTGATGYGMNWFDAMECCYYNGGYLAEVANAEEQAKLEAIMLAADGPQGLTAYWLGGNDLHHEGGWIWPSGSPKEHKWMDLECNQPMHASVLHFAACEKIPG